MFIKAEYYNPENKECKIIVLNTEYITHIEPVKIVPKDPAISNVYMDTKNGYSSFLITSPTFDILVARLTS